MGPREVLVSHVLLALVLDAHAFLPLPDYVRPCSVNETDKKMSECGTKHAREVMPHVMKGDPKYDVPVLDPLHMDELVVINGNGPLGLRLIANDVNVYGMPDIVINNIIHQSEPLLETYVATIPDVTVRAKYNITGRILLLPIVGEGNVVMKFKNMKLVYQFNAELKKLDDGEIYFVQKPGARLDAEVDGMSIQLDNLFNGDKTLLETTNQFLNDEWREVFEALKPSFAKAISDMMSDVLNGIFTKVPYRIAFLDTGL